MKARAVHHLLLVAASAMAAGVVLGAPASVQASCGGYVTMSLHGIAAPSAHDMPPSQPPLPAAPCKGPSCSKGQHHAPLAPMRVPTTHDNNNWGIIEDVGSSEVALPSHYQPDIVRAVLLVQISDIFHPPR